MEHLCLCPVWVLYRCVVAVICGKVSLRYLLYMWSLFEMILSVRGDTYLWSLWKKLLRTLSELRYFCSLWGQCEEIIYLYLAIRSALASSLCRSQTGGLFGHFYEVNVPLALLSCPVRMVSFTKLKEHQGTSRELLKMEFSSFCPVRVVAVTFTKENQGT